MCAASPANQCSPSSHARPKAASKTGTAAAPSPPQRSLRPRSRSTRTRTSPSSAASDSACRNNSSHASSSSRSECTRASCVSTSARPTSEPSRSSCSRSRASLASTSSKSQSGRRRSGIYRNVARLRGDSIEPGAHCRVRPEREPALAGDVRVAVEREVGERQRVADDVVTSVEMLVERAQHALARLHLRRELGLERLGTAGVRNPEAHDGDRGLEVVLLEEHPLQHLRAFVRICGNEARALAEVPEDRARRAERTSVVEHERRHTQRRVEPAEHLRPVRPVDHVQRTTLVRDPELGKQEPNLVAVARDRAVVQEDQASTMASIASATSPARNGVPRTRLKPVASTRNSARISFCNWPRLISGTSTFW